MQKNFFLYYMTDNVRHHCRHEKMGKNSLKNDLFN